MKTFLKSTVCILGLLIFIFIIGFDGWMLRGMIEENQRASRVGNLQLEEVFLWFTQEDEWKDASMSEIESWCEELSVLISEELSLDNQMDIKIISDETISWSGICLYDGYTIEINMCNIYSYCSRYDKDVPTYIVNVLAHEHRHAWQFERLYKGYDTALEQSLLNYIRPEDDYQKYYNQFCEVDARNYGAYYESVFEMYVSNING